MSTDERVTTDIIETLKDGQKGYSDAAERLKDESDASTVDTLREIAGRRGAFAAELEQMAASYGDNIDEDGSVAAAVHRGWLKLKDAVTGDKPGAVLDACESGDDHAVSEYESALEKEISPELRSVLERQLIEVRQARETVSALASAAR